MQTSVSIFGIRRGVTAQLYRIVILNKAQEVGVGDLLI